MKKTISQRSKNSDFENGTMIEKRSTSEMCSGIDKQLILHNLLMSNTTWKAIPQKAHIREKHPLAICGSLVHGIELSRNDAPTSPNLKRTRSNKVYFSKETTNKDIRKPLVVKTLAITMRRVSLMPLKSLKKTSAYVLLAKRIKNRVRGTRIMTEEPSTKADGDAKNIDSSQSYRKRHLPWRQSVDAKRHKTDILNHPLPPEQISTIKNRGKLKERPVSSEETDDAILNIVTTSPCSICSSMVRNEDPVIIHRSNTEDLGLGQCRLCSKCFKWLSSFLRSLTSPYQAVCIFPTPCRTKLDRPHIIDKEDFSLCKQCKFQIHLSFLTVDGIQGCQQLVNNLPPSVKNVLRILKKHSNMETIQQPNLIVESRLTRIEEYAEILSTLHQQLMQQIHENKCFSKLISYRDGLQEKLQERQSHLLLKTQTRKDNGVGELECLRKVSKLAGKLFSCNYCNLADSPVDGTFFYSLNSHHCICQHCLKRVNNLKLNKDLRSIPFSHCQYVNNDGDSAGAEIEWLSLCPPHSICDACFLRDYENMLHKDSGRINESAPSFGGKITRLIQRRRDTFLWEAGIGCYVCGLSMEILLELQLSSIDKATLATTLRSPYDFYCLQSNGEMDVLVCEYCIWTFIGAIKGRSILQDVQCQNKESCKVLECKACIVRRALRLIPPDELLPISSSMRKVLTSIAEKIKSGNFHELNSTTATLNVSTGVDCSLEKFRTKMATKRSSLDQLLESSLEFLSKNDNLPSRIRQSVSSSNSNQGTGKASSVCSQSMQAAQNENGKSESQCNEKPQSFVKSVLPCGSRVKITAVTSSKKLARKAPLGVEDSSDAGSSVRERPIIGENTRSMIAAAPSSEDECSLSELESEVDSEIEEDNEKILPNTQQSLRRIDGNFESGRAIITTKKSIPPANLCYSCGSGGGNTLFCVSCCEPYHFYCIERRFRPKTKDFFVCRNCIRCDECSQPASNLRCFSCARFYHPTCLDYYPPAKQVQSSSIWLCPQCAKCRFCDRTYLHFKDFALNTSDDSFEDPEKSSDTVWSKDSDVCKECFDALKSGDQCPECHRVYHSGCNDMLQCDGCDLWVHRPCANLTVDEYETLNTLPAPKLRRVTFNCSSCSKKNMKSTSRCRGANSTIKEIARHTFLGRMQDYLESFQNESRLVNGIPGQTGSVRTNIPQYDGIYCDENEENEHDSEGEISEWVNGDHISECSDATTTNAGSEVTSITTTFTISENSDSKKLNSESKGNVKQTLLKPWEGLHWLQWTSELFVDAEHLVGSIVALVHLYHNIRDFHSVSQAMLIHCQHSTKEYFPWIEWQRVVSKFNQMLHQLTGKHDPVRVLRALYDLAKERMDKYNIIQGSETGTRTKEHNPSLWLRDERQMVKENIKHEDQRWTQYFARSDRKKLAELWRNFEKERSSESYATMEEKKCDSDENNELSSTSIEMKLLKRCSDKVSLDSLNDSRVCSLCKQRGDRFIESRLLYAGCDQWVHVNCALWSQGVYETDESDELQDVHRALKTGSNSVCSICNKNGATISCNATSSRNEPCTSGSRHFLCALSSGAIFTKNGSVYCCQDHALIHGPDDSWLALMDVLPAHRRVCLPNDCYLRTGMLPIHSGFSRGLLASELVITIGAMQITQLGSLSGVSSDLQHLTPTNFECHREFFSCTNIDCRETYVLRVVASSIAKDSLINFAIPHKVFEEAKPSNDGNISTTEFDEGVESVMEEPGCYSETVICDSQPGISIPIYSHKFVSTRKDDVDLDKKPPSPRPGFFPSEAEARSYQYLLQGVKASQMNVPQNRPPSLLFRNIPPSLSVTASQLFLQQQKRASTGSLDLNRISHTTGTPLTVQQQPLIASSMTSSVTFHRGIHSVGSIDLMKPSVYKKANLVKLNSQTPPPENTMRHPTKFTVLIDSKSSSLLSNPKQPITIVRYPVTEKITTQTSQVNENISSDIPIIERSYSLSKVPSSIPLKFPDHFPSLPQMDGENDSLDNESTNDKGKKTTRRVSKKELEEKTQKSLQVVMDRKRRENDTRQHEALRQRERELKLNRLLFAVENFGDGCLNPRKAWQAVVNQVQELRSNNCLPQINLQVHDGWRQFGLSHPDVIYLVEQMIGAYLCTNYNFVYHKQLIEEQQQKMATAILNPSGSARTENYYRRHKAWKERVRKHALNPADGRRDRFGFLLSRPNTRPNYRPGTLRYQQTRRLARRRYQQWVAQKLQLNTIHRLSYRGGNGHCAIESWDMMCRRDPQRHEYLNLLCRGAVARHLAVAVHPSPIHARGLFALRDFEQDEMIIEYCGELIRNSLVDRRERYYRLRGEDCFLFRVNRKVIVDATLKGNVARFINHSCQPNSYAKIIKVDSRSLILIFAQQKIYRGEEITYDYCFPRESDKVRCNCGAETCRKYLN